MFSKKCGIVFMFTLTALFSFSKVQTKTYVSAQELFEDSFKLGKDVYDSGFHPTVVIALWRGGTPIGVVITEFFSYKGEKIEKHFPIKTEGYDHDKKRPSVKVFGLECIADEITKDDKILIVDDVVDSGATIEMFMKKLGQACDDEMPSKKNIKIATVYYKPETAVIEPDFYVYKTNDWIVFPHEMEGMSFEEIERAKGKSVAQMLK